MSDGDLSENWPQKAALTALILVVMVPGLVIEPGPISEVVGFAAIGSVWGLDFAGGGA